ncbi:SRPBCC family protein [Tsukamurella sp. 8F]|uniref:SRPBCC family protein n=1 Tax=unclassified Tsukamurella TaxID=2633480 RepID=UPI0023B89EAC|nr:MULTISPECIES: SRPBCC family protein [unclassified Tsukamurella]MDF0529851.1 SRPBCC family protein [Tsukamurella sp. 8J]MDF0587043.1 SRPBCC family protein [Tsukamurella sp. 8F]
MPALHPVPSADLQPGRPGVHEFSVRSARSVDWVWEELTSDNPLHWCKSLRAVRWTSPRPFAAGTTRRVVLGPGVSADELFFQWDEIGENREMAFYVQSATAPGLSRLAERYRVEPAPTGGSVFTWTLLVEPVGGRIGARLAAPVLTLIVASLRRDTEKYFSA